MSKMYIGYRHRDLDKLAARATRRFKDCLWFLNSCTGTDLVKMTREDFDKEGYSFSFDDFRQACLPR